MKARGGQRESRAIHQVVSTFDVEVPMRDGVALSADIFLPDAPGPFPTIFLRTPYDNATQSRVRLGHFYARRGYACVVQDCRGRFDSDGVFSPWHVEAEDGYDSQEWIGHQAWCDGKIGTVGASYEGLTQWLSAPLRSRYLAAMVPRVTPSDFWRETNYSGGAFALGLSLSWALETSSRSMQNVETYDWPQLYRHLPLIEADRAAGRNVDFYQDWLRHPAYDDYWKSISNHHRYREIDVPVLTLAGWFDAYNGGAFRNFTGMVSGAMSPTARKGQHLLIGPWAHELSVSEKIGQIDFGPESVLDLQALELRWFDFWLKGIDNGIMDEPPITLFVMGMNEWRQETEWPLASTEFRDYYLHSDGNAGGLMGDGSLTTRLPDSEPPDQYIYDPDNPSPSLGGNHSIPPNLVTVGPWDQRILEGRQDTLVYTSDPVEQDLEVTGPVILKLFASSSAVDTDFVAKLIDVYPDGRSMNLCEGILRARYRASFEDPRFLKPGTTYQFDIDMEVTSNVFKRGHRIRLDVSSSNFPRFDRNLNTNAEVGRGVHTVQAVQTVQHSGQFPSRLILPVVP